MASYDFIPTPPTRLESPYRSFKFNGIGENESFIFTAGWWRGIAQHWQLYWLQATLTCSAVVQNRSIRVSVTSDMLPDEVSMMFLSGATVTANNSDKLYILPVTYRSTNIGDNGEIIAFNDLVIQGDQYFKIYIGNDEAGDNMEGIFIAKYKNYELGLPGPWDECNGG